MQSYTPQRRVGMKDHADAFVRGNGHAVYGGSAFRTTREIAYSYAEPIAVFDPERQGTLLISTAKFSATTSKHQGTVERAAYDRGVPYDRVDHERVRAAAGRAA
jgi:hypothetical protein